MIDVCSKMEFARDENIDTELQTGTGPHTNSYWPLRQSAISYWSKYDKGGQGKRDGVVCSTHCTCNYPMCINDVI